MEETPVVTDPWRFAAIYLNDQLAMGVAWRELARRTAGHGRAGPEREILRRVADGIAEDLETHKKIMALLGIPTSRIKLGLAAVAERLGRVKPNGRLLSLSPLSRFEELEFLAMGIDGRKQLWATLRDLIGLADRLPEIDFAELIHRAERQRADMEPVRLAAGTAAFGVTAVPHG
ncbi:hypothetical protein D5S17_17340 [Pseudonocardiaceae bacterium YIM PH 21723]|nr:hypothetical protein D5S17_17340 [Pseudonocardiaceae bacterium YIM PH 21723]